MNNENTIVTVVVENLEAGAKTEEVTTEEVKAKKRNITKHFAERWVERILGIKEQSEANKYISTNRDKIVADANKSFEFSEFLYKGQIGDNTTKNYHIKDNMIFVTNTDDNAFITIYKTDFGFSDKINTSVRKGLVEEVIQLREEKFQADFAVEEELEEKQQELYQLDDEIKIALEQLNNLKERRKFADEEVRNIKKKSLNVGLELKKKINHLVNSKEYKSDLNKM